MFLEGVWQHLPRPLWIKCGELGKPDTALPACLSFNCLQSICLLARPPPLPKLSLIGFPGIVRKINTVGWLSREKPSLRVRKEDTVTVH